ncbi:DUF2442 domain-containing protein [Cuneatibacter sp. NSJ-177]|uniref:DUF2442 domain-containing protein n=1 Tax=Cuneatibacter sp. NSJ-177 TaxID=2931401 RepID=UPI001FD5B9F0|nr:DUF2442 domain-containing protein [Cuneatibacter sp. NSJ-177]MCJ7836141.1 DUF2442 domain-containing protein [Cuneatibacter sp. NSJ-177]
MYLHNGIVYAGELVDEIRVKEAKALPFGMLLLTFSTGEKRLFDTTSLTGSAFKPLADEQIFSNVQVVHGFVSWLDGKIDCAPEYMYENSYAYEEEFVI